MARNSYSKYKFTTFLKLNSIMSAQFFVVKIFPGLKPFCDQNMLQLYRGNVLSWVQWRKFSWVEWQNEIGYAGIRCVWSNLGGNSGELSSRVIPWLIGALGTPLLSGTDTHGPEQMSDQTNMEDKKVDARITWILQGKHFYLAVG